MEIAGLEVLNSKEKKAIISLTEKQYGATIDKDSYVFLKSKKNKVYIINSKLNQLELGNLKIKSIGLYFAEVRDSLIRLSVEGSQLIGPNATKGVLELNESQIKQYIKGYDIESEEFKNLSDSFYIIKYKSDFFGCGKISNKKLFNYLPKTRRVSST